MRLPKVASKKDKRGREGDGGSGGGGGYGGEEWRGLGEGVERIDRLTSSSKGRGGDGRGVLERSRKRGAEGLRGSGLGSGDLGIGERFEKRRRMVERGSSRRMARGRGA